MSSSRSLSSSSEKIAVEILLAIASVVDRAVDTEGVRGRLTNCGCLLERGLTGPGVR
jgi:hypothetical protein